MKVIRRLLKGDPNSSSIISGLKNMRDKSKPKSAYYMSFIDAVYEIKTGTPSDQVLEDVQNEKIGYDRSIFEETVVIGPTEKAEYMCKVCHKNKKRWRKEVKKNPELYDKHKEVIDDPLYEWWTKSEQKQLRSADEGMTTVIECHRCGSSRKRSN